MKKLIFVFLALMVLVPIVAMANGEKYKQGAYSLSTSTDEVSTDVEDSWNSDSQTVSDDARKKKKKSKSGSIVMVADLERHLGKNIKIADARSDLMKLSGIDSSMRGQWFRLGVEFSGADTISEIVMMVCWVNATAQVLQDNGLTWESARNLKIGFEFFIRAEYLKEKYSYAAEIQLSENEELIALREKVAFLEQQLAVERSSREKAEVQVAKLQSEKEDLLFEQEKVISDYNVLMLDFQNIQERIYSVSQKLGDVFADFTRVSEEKELLAQEITLLRQESKSSVVPSSAGGVIGLAVDLWSWAADYFLGGKEEHSDQKQNDSEHPIATLPTVKVRPEDRSGIERNYYVSYAFYYFIMVPKNQNIIPLVEVFKEKKVFPCNEETWEFSGKPSLVRARGGPV